MTPQCETIQSECMSYLDNELSKTEASSFENHINDCSSCSSFVQTRREEHTELRQLLRAEPAPEALFQHISQRLEQNDLKRRPRHFAASWALPSLATFAAAAVLTLFVQKRLATDNTEVIFNTSPSLARVQANKNVATPSVAGLPVRHDGASQAPRFGAKNVLYRGSMQDRIDYGAAPYYLYETKYKGKPASIKVYPKTIPDQALTTFDRHEHKGDPMWLKRVGQSNVVYLKNREGKGAIIASTLPMNLLVEVILNSSSF